jgi:hypothetical protein
LHAIDEVANLACFDTVHLPVAKKIVGLNEQVQQGALENSGNLPLVSKMYINYEPSVLAYKSGHGVDQILEDRVLSNNPHISDCCVDKDNGYLVVPDATMWRYHAVDMVTAVGAFRHAVVPPRSRRGKSGNLGYLAARMYESNLVEINGNLRKTVNCRVQIEHNSNDKYQNGLKKYCAYRHLDGDNWDLHQDVGDLIDSKDVYRALVETQTEMQVIHSPCCGERRHFRRVKIHILDEYTYRSGESYGKI